MTLGQLIDVIAHCKRNIFPVLNDENKLVGVVYLDNIREIMFNPAMYENTLVKSICSPVSGFIQAEDSMQTVMQKFETLRAWNLPVIEQGKYIGFLSKSAIFNEYRKLLIKQGKIEEIPI